MGVYKQAGIALLCALFLSIFSGHSAAFDLSKPIKEIKIEGNQRANGNTIRFYVRSKVGETYSIPKTREDIRRIFNLKYFDEVILEVDEKPDGLILIFKVVEKPFVRKVRFSGLKDFPERDLRLFLKLKKGTYFQKHFLKKDINKIKAKYQKRGFYFTTVTPIVKDVGNNQVDVTYSIKENQKVKVTNINFNGNSFIKEYELREMMETDTLTFWSIISETGNYQREIIKTDRLRLESKYREFGFIKAMIEEPRIEVDKDNGFIEINFFIHENDQYFVGKITAEGDDIFSAKDILEKITIKEGDPFNQTLFRENLFKVTEMYSNKGYAYATPLPKMTENEETKTVDIHIKVDPGDKIYIGKINIAGNEKTHENVIRREFRIHEGELFQSSKMTRTRQRINNTRFFESIEIDQKSGSKPELMDLDVNVIERSTGSIQAGMGYNTSENFTITLGITENNLLGSGKSLSLKADNSQLKENYSLSLTEPRFKDRDIFLSLALFSEQADLLTYTTDSKGGSATIGRGIGEYTSVKLRYKLQEVDTKISDTVNLGAFLSSMQGKNITSSLMPIYTVDTRDDVIFTKSGYKVVADAQVAGGLLGGDLDFYKLGMTGSKYYPLPKEFALHLHSQIDYGQGYNGKDLPLFENYFLGGRRLRGFNFSDVGPLDATGDSIGGDSSLLFSVGVNYSFSKAVMGTLFYDRGQVYGENGDLSRTTGNRFDLEKMRHSYGFSLSLYTPMGPITLSWGFKLDRRTTEAPMQFDLAIGGGAF